MSQRARSGILPVEKGAGVTSFQVVAHLRRALRAPKVGHGGTLDPDATGVLPILIGEATKLTPYLVDLEKEYVATVRLGVVTDTQDLSGAVLETRTVQHLDAARIDAALARFVGVIRQVPPMYSALHHDGRRLYELAREGRTVERESREITVHAIALETVALPDVTVRVRCGKGTYIRVLASDLGDALGCGGTLARLVRTRVGPFALADAVPWADVSAARDGSALWERLRPMDAALAAFPAVRLDATQIRRFANGQSAPASAAGLVRVYGPGDVLVGIGVATGTLVKPERLFHADPPRPAIVSA